jgi:deoxycytidylate deaminase
LEVKNLEIIVGGKLFCTTYPCHNCARHIVLAGITEVYFIEPYSKSLATVLHSDSITDDENESNKVKILLYDGVSPNRYMQLFKVNEQSRKNSEGKVNKPKQKDASPKFTETLEALYTLESTATKNLKDFNLKLI